MKSLRKAYVHVRYLLAEVAYATAPLNLPDHLRLRLLLNVHYWEKRL